ncbi:MAG: sugar transferase [Candidatus Paceibacterota bacterium]
MTNSAQSKGAAILIVGDLIVYIFALILTLTVRYEAVPGKMLLLSHLPSFSILFVIFVIVSFSAGLYDKQAAFIRGQIQGLLLKVQVVNIALGIIFFYVAPVAIAPKANLVIYFIISTLLLLLWRTIMFPVFSVSKRQIAILVGQGQDIEDILEEVNGNSRYGLLFSELIKPQVSVDGTVAAIAKAVSNHSATVIVADLHNPAIEAATPFLYSLVFSGIKITNASKLYEGIFDRIPLSLVGQKWLVENSSTALGSRRLYDLVKRVTDILAAGLIGIVSLVFYPFIYLAIKLEDGGPIFISQERVGKNGKTMKIVKFRSMSGNDSGVYGKDGKTTKYVTKIGKFIRFTRIDELPQVWSVIKGDQSLIGPRPEFPSLAKIYEREIPYYNVRHLIKPGLSGWAQIYHRAHPHHAVAVEDTRDKLSYDLYYIKNRSLTLDLRIAMQTLKSILSKQGI